ncbi:MAG: hypothetical protein A2534_00040 [Candidatus Magasanikbacteria bacterium RIFOXYD2_FULL_39_9]|uniref:Major facilitator superfamily (MFS) profile domain-containing protein n=1 Tax=Candidatus Magasanikbacteria bacterium RIFOXYD1_FULL_40_23 TaxID=1798705 RepID=A0A1F6P9M0_9BACT|nr:MAG: hypothetical protein A2534_00040 [Candidatus Magasanikbacteria bacterium RIFOXYD2_FULL_39_9]OGH92808.1 MAG: hypothetical protein A2563_04020 [Candidatus Magasanikbacteria bacterium RIFOXYD1_FULL_40_23]
MLGDRKSKLEKNFFKIFFINALLNVKMINIVISLFYVYRSLRVADIFYLGVVYSATVILSEVPSSYLADRFGRKRTIIMAAFFGLLHWVFFLTANSFFLFAIGIVFYALAESCMSGTDEAFVYDTNKELNNQSQSLQKLSRYFSSERFFKIFSAFLGAIIAKDLLDWQFNSIIMVDMVASVVAIIFAFTLLEPNHFMDVEKQEAGLIKDAYKILSRDKTLMFSVLNKLLVLIGAHLCWAYATVFFVDNLSISVVTMGIVWSVYHFLVLGASHFLHSLWPNHSETVKINMLSAVVSAALGMFLFSWFFFPYKYILLAFYLIVEFTASIRQPIFSNIFNKQFFSYNRATTLSMANFVQHVFQIPLLLLTGWLVGINIIFPYVVALFLALAAVLYFRINQKEPNNVYVSKTI